MPRDNKLPQPWEALCFTFEKILVDFGDISLRLSLNRNSFEPYAALIPRQFAFHATRNNICSLGILDKGVLLRQLWDKLRLFIMAKLGIRFFSPRGASKHVAPTLPSQAQQVRVHRSEVRIPAQV